MNRSVILIYVPKVEIHMRVTEHAGKHDTTRCWELRWSGHAVTAKGTLANTVVQGKVEEKRSRGCQQNTNLDDVKQWTWLHWNEMPRNPEHRVSVVLPQPTELSMTILRYQ